MHGNPQSVESAGDFFVLCGRQYEYRHGDEYGRDDFIPKPFDLEVLTAKIQALLRRSYDFAGSSSMLEHKGAVLKLLDASLIWNGQQIELTKNELKILQTLMEHKEKLSVGKN